MDSGGFTLRWEEDSRGQSGGVVSEDVICSMDGSVQQHFNNIEGNNSHLTNESIIADDQIAAENLIYLAQDIVGQISGYAEAAQYRTDGYTLEQAELEQGDEVECQVTEEIITDDWVQPGGQEQVEVPLEQLVMVTAEPTNEENSIDVPLPTDQDEYTAMRPYPCDFCSRRFRKKANLMNHMVAHQNDRQFGCNLCGTRYGRRSDLLNHLKIHATVPDDAEDPFNEFEPIMQESPPRRRHRRRSPHSIKNDDYSFINDMETSVAARTQQYDAAAASSSMRSINQYQVTDPSRPFVCQHCGIGFAREKALASHARIHGGDSPIECGICGEMCWSREQLSSHTKNKHPHRAPQSISPLHGDFSSDSSFSDEYVEKTIDTQPVGPELICKDCGVGFQRADLLRRHVRAAHKYKMEPQQDVAPTSENTQRDDDNDPWGTNEHSCGQCGERFREPLDLLAHAGTHAGQRGSSTKRSSGAQRDKSVDCNVCGERFPDKMALISHRHIHSGNGKQFPCRECGKTFGSRSSQQIHERIHTGERPYSCRFCWKAFADGGTLRKHERIHTGEKPYACAVCPRAFNQRVVLREHVRSHHSAADSRRGTTATPFWCPVCGQLFATSVDLIQHIIGHCDANTAMKRQPQVGPRKYKRRRKTMPFDSDMNKDDDEKIDSDMSGQEEEYMIEEELMSPRRQSTSTSYRRSRRTKASPPSSGDEMDAIRASLERSSRIIESSISGSARTKGKTKSKSYPDIQRPKMIHTQRTKVADSDSPVGKRKKRITTTTITTTSTLSSNTTPTEERLRARIKNVKLPGDGRLPKASFTTSVKPEPETETDISADLTAILHGAETLEEVVEEEIILDTTFDDDPKIIKKEPSHDNHESQSTIKVKNEKEDANSMIASITSSLEGANSKNGPFRCEMCSESFLLREELLVHVPIHIT